MMYKETHFDPEIKKACDIILRSIDLTKLVNYSPKTNYREARALQITLANKMAGDPRHVADILDEVLKLLNSDSIF